MKFYIILSLLYLNLKVFANPVSTEAVDILTESNNYDEEIEIFFNDKDMVSDIIDLEEEECTSEECIQTSKRILDNMDLSVDPCDNFYQFTCGGFEEKEDISKSTFEILSDTTKMEIRNIFKSEYKVDEKLSKEDQAYDKKLYNKLMNYYNICMNKELNDSYPNEHLINFIKNLNITEIKESIKEPETFTNTLIKFTLNGIDTFFEFFPFSNEKISDRPITALRGPVLLYFKSMNYNILEKSPDGLQLYKEFIKNILTILYKNETNIDLMADNIYKTESKLLKMMNQNKFLDSLNMDINERSPESYELLKIKELNDKYPFMDWNLYFNSIFGFYNMSEFINDDMIIFNSIPQILKGINDLINEISVDDLVNYLEWCVISLYSQSDVVSEDVLKTQQEYDKMTSELLLSLSPEDMKEVLGSYLSDLANIGSKDEFLKKLRTSLFSKENKENNENKENENEEITEEEDRFDNCFSILTTLMPKAVSRYFILMNFENNFKDDFKEMIENIKETMINRIPQMEWLDEETKEYAIEKVVKMKDRIGYPDDIMDPKKVYQIYESLEIDNYFDLINKSYVYGNGEILKEFDLNEWFMNPYITNAYYDFYDNSINFPAAIIQKPFFGNKEQDYINYALIGFVAGHELTHAFDNNGKLYDVDGHLNNWWTDNDNEEFNEFSQCFIDEYNSITYKYIDMLTDKEINMNINGKKTLGENLADNGGLARAYDAWRLSLLKNPEEADKRNMKLPGFENYTIDQLFYIVYGQSFCSTGGFINQMDVHSPGIGRVNGVVANSEHFAKTFKCPKNSAMNPENKCHIW